VAEAEREISTNGVSHKVDRLSLRPYRTDSGTTRRSRSRISDKLSSAKVWGEIKSELSKALIAVAKESEDVWQEATAVVKQIKQQVVANLKPTGVSELRKFNIKVDAETRKRQRILSRS
jgi:hypothetical protein